MSKTGKNVGRVWGRETEWVEVISSACVWGDDLVSTEREFFQCVLFKADSLSWEVRVRLTRWVFVLRVDNVCVVEVCRGIMLGKFKIR